MITQRHITGKKSTSSVKNTLPKLNLPKDKIAKKKGGRPAGSRNKKTLVAMAVRDGLEQQLLDKGQEILQVIMDQAIDGCRPSQKMIMDRLMPTMKASDGDNKPTNSFTITIGKLEDTPQVKKIQGEVIDADQSS